MTILCILSHSWLFTSVKSYFYLVFHCERVNKKGWHFVLSSASILTMVRDNKCFCKILLNQIFWRSAVYKQLQQWEVFQCSQKISSCFLVFIFLYSYIFHRLWLCSLRWIKLKLKLKGKQHKQKTGRKKYKTEIEILSNPGFVRLWTTRPWIFDTGDWIMYSYSYNIGLMKEIHKETVAEFNFVSFELN